MADNKVTPSAVISNDISPDGSPTGNTAAAPLSSQVQKEVQQPPAEKKIESIKDLDKVDDGQQYQPPVKDAKEPTIDDFLDAGAKLVEPKKEIEPIKDKQSPTDDKVIEQPKGDDKQDDKQDDNARDFTGIDEAFVPHFKRMSNEAFNRLKPLYLEHAKTKQEFEQLKEQHKKTAEEFESFKKNGPQIPENYYDHPQAFVLTPEFTSKLQQTQDSELIYNHWTKQLDKIAAGEKEVDILDIDRRTGEYYISKSIPADRNAENQISKWKAGAERILVNNQAELQAIQKTFHEKYKQSRGEVSQIENAYFSGLDKPENKQTYDPIIKDTYDKLPPALKLSNGMFIAKALTLLTVFGNLLKQAAAEKTGQQQQTNGNGNGNTNGQQQRISGPSAGETSGGGARSNTPGSKEVSMDDFEALKNGI